MSLRINARRCLTIAAFAAVASLSTLAVSPAQAGNEPYLGWDFGHGMGVGVGTPPSSYDACPHYGWGPGYWCHHHHYRPVHYRHYHHRHHETHPARPAPRSLGPSDAQ